MEDKYIFQNGVMKLNPNHQANTACSPVRAAVMR